MEGNIQLAARPTCLHGVKGTSKSQLYQCSPRHWPRWARQQQLGLVMRQYTPHA